MRITSNKGFTLLEVLVVIAIIGTLIGIAIPVFSGQVNQAKTTVDLANMRSAYALAQAECMTDPSPDKGPYYFNGTSLQSDATGITGYGQSTEHASDFADGFPVEVTGVPNTTGNSSGAKYLVIFCDDKGVSRVSWGDGGYVGKQALTPQEHEEVAADKAKALNVDVELLNALENSARDMTFKEIRDLISKYGIEKGSIGGATCLKIAICNVDQATGLPIPEQTAIYAPELFEAAGYDTSAEAQYILQGRDSYKNGDVIWLCLGTNLDNAADNAKPTKSYTYVKSNGDPTDESMRQVNRANLNNR